MVSDQALAQYFDRAFLVRAVFLGLLLSLVLLGEIFLAIVAADSWGVYLTLAILSGTGLFGAFAILQSMYRIISRLRLGIPGHRERVRELRGAAALLVGGLFVLIPGFATDGLFLLIWLTPLRGLVGALLFKVAGIHADRTYELARVHE